MEVLKREVQKYEEIFKSGWFLKKQSIGIENYIFDFAEGILNNTKNNFIEQIINGIEKSQLNKKSKWIVGQIIKPTHIKIRPIHLIPKLIFMSLKNNEMKRCNCPKSEKIDRKSMEYCSEKLRFKFWEIILKINITSIKPNGNIPCPMPTIIKRLVTIVQIVIYFAVFCKRNFDECSAGV